MFEWVKPGHSPSHSVIWWWWCIESRGGCSHDGHDDDNDDDDDNDWLREPLKLKLILMIMTTQILSLD